MEKSRKGKDKESRKKGLEKPKKSHKYKTHNKKYSIFEHQIFFHFPFKKKKMRNTVIWLACYWSGDWI